MKTKDNLTFLMSLFLIQARCLRLCQRGIFFEEKNWSIIDGVTYEMVIPDLDKKHLVFVPEDHSEPLTITGKEDHDDAQWQSFFTNLYYNAGKPIKPQERIEDLMAIIGLAFDYGETVGEAFALAKTAQTKQKGVDAPAAVNNGTFRSANQWFAGLSPDQLQAVTGLCRDNDKSFLDACDRWWLGKTMQERINIWKENQGDYPLTTRNNLTTYEILLAILVSLSAPGPGCRSLAGRRG